MLRTVGGVLIGLLAGAVAMLLIHLGGAFLFPSRIPVDPSDAQRLGEAFGQDVIAPQLYILFSWAGGALVGAAVSKRIVGRPWAAWTVAGFFALYAFFNTFILPMPSWLQVAAVLAPLLGGLLANHLVANRIVIEIDDEEDEAAADA